MLTIALLAVCGLGAALAWAANPVQENFESGAPGWTMTGTTGPTGPNGAPTTDTTWQILDHPEQVSVASPAINPDLVTLPDAGNLPSAFGGSHAAWFGDINTGTFCGAAYASVTQSAKNGCTSDQPQSGDLTSPSFSLKGAASAQVDFEAWWEIEAVEGDGFDRMLVQYSTDGGTTWQNAGSLNPIGQTGGAPDQSYSAQGIEQPPAWHHYVADISTAAGSSTVMVRFDFTTGDTLYNGFRGWLVDDVTVSDSFTASAPQVSSLAPTCVTTTSGTPVEISGSDFVLNSSVLIDGGQADQQTVPANVPSDQQVQFAASLPAGQHTVQVMSPNGATSNAVALTVADSCTPASPPPSSPPPPPATGVLGASAASLPNVSVGNPTAAEQASGVADAVFNVSLSSASGSPVSVSYQTQDGTARAGMDYSATRGTLIIPAGQTAGVIRVPVLPSSRLRPALTFTLRLTGASGATIGPGAAAGTATILPAPVFAKSVNLGLVSGQVFVKLPPGASLSRTGTSAPLAFSGLAPVSLRGGGPLANASLSKGVGFIPLTQARQVPVGSIVDATAGVASLTSATAPHGKLQSGDFGAGIFKILQNRRQQGVTQLNLINARTARQVCVSAGKASTARRRLSSKVLGLLNSSAHGRFTSNGQYSAATVRGTVWTIANRCDGTLTRVSRGVVVVRDFRRHRNITVRAGHSYLARAPGG